MCTGPCEPSVASFMEKKPHEKSFKTKIIEMAVESDCHSLSGSVESDIKKCFRPYFVTWENRHAIHEDVTVSS